MDVSTLSTQLTVHPAYSVKNIMSIQLISKNNGTVSTKFTAERKRDGERERERERERGGECVRGKKREGKKQRNTQLSQGLIKSSSSLFR